MGATDAREIRAETKFWPDASSTTEEPTPATPPDENPVQAVTGRSTTPGKLSFREQQRVDTLFREIEELETEQQQLNEAMSDPDFFKADGDEIAVATTRLKEINELLPERLSEWEELEARR